MNYLPAKLMKLRKHYSYSQAKIADAIGIDVTEYMAIENGRKVLNYNQCKKIANLYHVNVMDIFKNDEDVVLYDVSKTRTDELNIEFFIPEKSFGEKIKDFIKNHSVLLGVALGVVVLGIMAFAFFIKSQEGIPYTATLKDSNRLSVSNTTVVYISYEGAVKGSGDNSNSQLSNLPATSAIKVAEGGSFTIVLNDDGKVSGYGLINKYAEVLDKWTNIIDIAAGDNHVVAIDNRGYAYAVGNNDYGQCDVEDFKNIQKVYASHNGTILLTDNKLYCVGEFAGSSQLSNYENILDLDISNDNIVILSATGEVEYITTNKNFSQIYKWNDADIIDVACGDEFIAALTNEGRVLIDCDDDSVKKDVTNWENIIAIAAADDYLIAYDGNEIYGTGKNSYHQFKEDEIEKIILPQVSGVKISISNTVDVSFDKVDNAIGYKVELDLGEDSIVYPKVSSNQTVSFASDKLETDLTYTIIITALGDNENYLDSLPLEASFTFTKEDNSNDEYIDFDEELVGMEKEKFITYLKEKGVEESNIISVETSTPCEGNEETVLSVDGISKGQRIKRSDLKEAKITYNYCLISSEEVEETNDE